jgi:putative hemolysin
LEPESESLSFLLTELPLLLASFPSSETILGILSIALLLVVSGLISGSEVAFFSLTANDLNTLKNENGKSNQLILNLSKKPRQLLATILISNNFVNIAIVIISEIVIRQLFPEAFFNGLAEQIASWIPAESSVIANIARFFITVIGVTFLLVLFGEVAPKMYANLNNIRLIRLMARPLGILMQLFTPFNKVLVGFSDVIENRLNPVSRNSNFPSKAEIGEAIDLTVSQEHNTKQEIDILKRIVKFSDVSVKQIMRSRVDIVAIDLRSDFTSLVNLIRESGYSRIPVYDTDFDNVTGIFYAKDLLGHLSEDNQFEWQELIRTNVLYVPESKKINDLLTEFKTQKLHMAIIVDEYGGTSGLITLEDILEEVIGEIKDEFDDDIELEYKKIDDYNFIFDGKTLLNDLCKVLNIDSEIFDKVRGEADSLAGLVLELQGAFPKQGAEVFFDRFKFKMVTVSNRRIEKILLSINPD